jgi:hypothetical protein
MSHSHPVVAFSKIFHVFFLSWATHLALKLAIKNREEELAAKPRQDNEVSLGWVPTIVSPTTLCPISVDRENIQRNLNWEQATDLAQAVVDADTLARLATPAELREIFRQCGSNLPTHAPKTAWLSSTRGISAKVGGGFAHDGRVLTVNSETKQAEWRGPNDGGKYGLLFVRDEHSPS